MIYFSNLIEENYPNILQTLRSFGIKPDLLPHTKDIWCRDYMPVKTAKGNYVQFDLSKEYYLKKDKHKKTDPAPVCSAFDIFPKNGFFRDNIIKLDGGNVIMGYGRAFITDKVYLHNLKPNVVSEQAELKDVLQKLLEVDEVIVIPHEPWDYTGHADGMIRILDEKSVLVNDFNYQGGYPKFAAKFYNTIAKTGLKMEKVPYTPAKSENPKDRDQPATGCYINYLQVGNNVFLPQFNDSINDKKAVSRFEELFGRNNIVPVDCTELSKLGGVLNCITWEN